MQLGDVPVSAGMPALGDNGATAVYCCRSIAASFVRPCVRPEAHLDCGAAHMEMVSWTVYLKPRKYNFVFA
jgi:hypothetical protein